MKIFISSLFMLLLSFLLLVDIIKADSWLMPYTHNYFSDNGKYSFITLPSGKLLNPNSISSDYKYDHPENLKAPENNAVGILYQLESDSIYHPIWISDLKNRNSPVNALVHNQGKWVITFDDWHNVGRTDNAVVIYDVHGNVVCNLSIDDFLMDVKIANFTKTTSSTWWMCDAKFVDGKDQIEICTISNSTSFLSRIAICQDYTRLNLNNGELISFNSVFDEAQISYSEPCYDDYLCPFVRYFYYKMENSNIIFDTIFNSLNSENSPLDTIKTLYGAFKDEPIWKLGNALVNIGRKVLLATGDLLGTNISLIVEYQGEINDWAISDSFPVIIQFKDSTLAYPLALFSSDFTNAILEGATNLLEASYWTCPIGDEDNDYFLPMGESRFIICTPDSTYTYPTNINLLKLTLGSQVFINLAKDYPFPKY